MPDPRHQQHTTTIERSIPTMPGLASPASPYETQDAAQDQLKLHNIGPETAAVAGRDEPIHARRRLPAAHGQVEKALFEQDRLRNVPVRAVPRLYEEEHRWRYRHRIHCDSTRGGELVQGLKRVETRNPYGIAARSQESGLRGQGRADSTVD
ncbi:hypothetical protein ACFY7Z_10250 [Streptomyces sp. NPDC012623]|uniref:hypothetical protein n=1 Tax=unclassified Streptomyces TaxID=2593676 RepID=UPI0036BD7537